MSKPKFYKVELTEIPLKEVLTFAYERFPNSEKILNEINEGMITLDDRMGDCACPECSHREWLILPTTSNAVISGGKSYVECYWCGYITHL